MIEMSEMRDLSNSSLNMSVSVSQRLSEQNQHTVCFSPQVWPCSAAARPSHLSEGRTSMR